MQIDKFKVEDWMNEYEKYCLYDLGNTTVNTLSLNELFEICNANGVSTKTMLKIFGEAAEGGVFDEN